MKYAVLIFCLLFVLPVEGQIKGRILSEDKQPIQYVNIISITDKVLGTTTDETGFFNMAYNNSVWVYVSAIGYRDTLVLLEPSQMNSLVLGRQVYQLEEVVVNHRLKTSIWIGNRDIARKDGGLRFLYPGHLQGVVFKPKSKEVNRQIHSVEIYISDLGKPTTPMCVRILGFNKDIRQKNKAVSTEYTYDLASQTIVFTPQDTGWQRVNLSSLNMKIPSGDIAVLFYPLDKGRGYVWTDTDGKECYGPVLATSSSDNLRYDFIVLQHKEKKLFVVSSPLMRRNKPAIRLELN